MSEIRRDLLTGKWVIFATGEGLTTRDFWLRREGAVEPEPCPFDNGQEAATPPELFAVRPNDSLPNTPGWTVRVITDRLPILRPEAAEPRDDSPTHELHPARGHHEIVVLTPKHQTGLGELSSGEIETVLGVIRDRHRALTSREDVEHVLTMINHGRESGASLNHAHAQLFGLPFVPEDLEDELTWSEAHLQRTGGCLMCREVSFETKKQLRVIAENDEFVAYMPFASRFPFQVTVAAKTHSARFEETSDGHISELAPLLKQVLGMLFDRLDDPPYNLVIRSSPSRRASDLSFHWYIDILTRELFAANFELVSDVWVNSVTPESATRLLLSGEPEPRTQAGN